MFVFLTVVAFWSHDRHMTQKLPYMQGPSQEYMIIQENIFKTKIALHNIAFLKLVLNA